MLYTLSVYLLYGFIGAFLGGVCGPFIAILGHSLVAPGPAGDRAPGDFGAAFDLIGWGVLSGAALGLAAGLLSSHRSLRPQRIRGTQAETDQRSR